LGEGLIHKRTTRPTCSTDNEEVHVFVNLSDT